MSESVQALPDTKRRRIYKDNHVEWLRTVNTHILIDDLKKDSTRINACRALATSLDTIDMNMRAGSTTLTVWLILLEWIVHECTHTRQHPEVDTLVLALTRALPGSTWNLNVRDDKNQSCLHYAVRMCLATASHSVHMAFLGALMKVCDLEARDDDGDTPLLLSVTLEQYTPDTVFALMKFMVENGADPSAQNNRGNTLLHIVAFYPTVSTSILKDLMRHELLGCDWTLTNTSGNTFWKRHSGESLHTNHSFIRGLCEGWVERCMSFLHDEVNEVLKNRHLTDIVMMYIDGHDDVIDTNV
jgi:hypothetical protein